MANSSSTIYDCALTVIPHETAMQSIWMQYQGIIVHSLLTSFGLDLLIHDQHGGDVDTLHNVGQIDDDLRMDYKNEANKQDYENRGEYDSHAYHGHFLYRLQGAENKQARLEGKGIDEYTGQAIPRNAEMDLDHTIAAFEIQNDRRRVLAGLDGPTLANQKENLHTTDKSINRTKKQLPMEEYIKRLETQHAARMQTIQQLSEKLKRTQQEDKQLKKLQALERADIERMRAIDKNARQAYEKKLNQAYYTSARFRTDVATAAAKRGGQMALRQAIGLVFAEIIFAIQDEFKKETGDFEFKTFCLRLADAIKEGIIRAQAKYKEIVAQVFQGAFAGVFSSVFTSIANIFVTTSTRAVKIIRNVAVQLVESLKILFANPNHLPYGEQVRAASKCLAIGGSLVAGDLVSEWVETSPIGILPLELGTIIEVFCGTLVSGVLSCTFLYMIDNSDMMNDLVYHINQLDAVHLLSYAWKTQSENIDRYAAELFQLDFSAFQKQASCYSSSIAMLSATNTLDECNQILHRLMQDLEIISPWTGDFNEFMQNKNNRLVFT